MTPQTQKLIEAGYVTRKQAAAILGKGDGGNIVTLCKAAGVKYIEIPRGPKRVTTMFCEDDVISLLKKMEKRSKPKQTELPIMHNATSIGMRYDDCIVRTEYNDPMDIVPKPETDIMDALGRIEAMLTALLKR
jgi:hypothetical protein